MTVAERIFAIVAEVLGISPESLDERSGMGREPGWDSVRHVAIVARVEQELDIELDDDEVVEAIRIGGLVTIAARKVAR